jgi:hypothetical protein
MEFNKKNAAAIDQYRKNGPDKLHVAGYVFYSIVFHFIQSLGKSTGAESIADGNRICNFSGCLQHMVAKAISVRSI